MPRATWAAVLVPLTALTAGSLPLPAQVSSGHGPLILELPVTTAAQATAGALHPPEAPGSALFHNPAFLPRARGLSGSIQRYGGRATLVGLAAAAHWWGGGVGLGLRTLSFQGPAGAAGLPAGSEGALFADGSETVSQVAASAGWARRFGRAGLGLVGTFLEQRAGEERDVGGAVAVGAAVEWDPLDLGLAVRNLGPALELSGGELELPRRVELAASARDLSLGPLDVGAAGSLSRLADGEMIPALGVELAYWPVVGRTFVLRGGVRRIPRGPADEFSFGAAFHGDEIVLEYAYQGFDGLGGAHRFGIGWR